MLYKYNFSAGPSVIDHDVLRHLAADIQDYKASGIGILEYSHRDEGDVVQNCIQNTSLLLRKVMSVPSSHEILFMHGGAHAMFAAVPLNLAGPEVNSKAVFIGDGFWNRKMAEEAKKYCKPVFVSEDDREEIFTAETKFIHVTANETISGIELHEDFSLPKGAPPLVGDFTSTFLSRKIDFSKYGVVYASTGKNLGPSGMVVVIVRKSLLEERNREMSICPGIMSFRTVLSTKPISNLFNTPNVFCVRALQLILEKIKNGGGIQKMNERAKSRSKKIYDAIDGSEGFYINSVAKVDRSMTSIPFRIRDLCLEAKFVQQSISEGFYNLVGHPLFGGLRVCIYNQLPDEAVFELVKFMKKFKQENINGIDNR